MSKTAYLFPGQGSQSVGMGADLCAHSAAARTVFDEADAYYSAKISTICFYGPEDALRETIYTQPALFVTSVAALRTLEEAGAEAPEAAAGHSVGEYAALVAVGALDFATAMRLVERRAQEMHRASLASGGAMAAVLGLTADQVRSVCAESEESGAGPVQAANFNGAGQVVISGSEAGVAAAAEALKAAGAKRVIPLKVSGAFHSSLMRPAAEAMALVLGDVAVKPASIPVVANVTADYERSPDEIRANLASQIDGPVRWEESIARLLADGFDTFVEVGSGAVLAGLMKRAAPEAVVYSAADAAGIARIVAEIGNGLAK